jgi:hypothetical protein
VVASFRTAKNLDVPHEALLSRRILPPRITEDRLPLLIPYGELESIRFWSIDVSLGGFGPNQSLPDCACKQSICPELRTYLLRMPIQQHIHYVTPNAAELLKLNGFWQTDLSKVIARR